MPALLIVPALSLTPAPAVTTGARVTGTIRIEQATIRPDGPKHDRDVVIMLDRAGGAPAPQAGGRATMDQKGMVFIPHVLALQKGTTVRFLNNDNDQHNVYLLDDKSGATRDIGTYGPGISVDHTFAVAGPVIVLCKLHLEMAAYIVVTDTPWFAAVQVDPDTKLASFAIANVPAGEYTLRVWHKKLKAIDDARRLVVPADGSVDVPVVLTTAARAKSAR